ncbi:MAG: ABC transporter ATP-binding protein, partial [Huintestinicola sp.]
MQDNVLTADNLAVGYGSEILIDNIRISLLPGKIVTLIGPNGAGKSTILKTVSRQIRSLGGAVFVGKEELSCFKGEELAKEMSLLMTVRTDPELMTCREAVGAGRYPYTGRLGILSPEDKRAVAEAMELTDVTELADRDISRISDGQRQRV